MRQQGLDSLDLFVQIAQQPFLILVRIGIEEPRIGIEPANALTDRALAHALSLEDHIDPRGQVGGLVQTHLMDLVRRQGRGGRGLQRRGIIGLTVWHAPNARIMDGLGLEAGDQIGLTVEGRLNLVLIDLGRCRRIVAEKPLGLGAAHQRLDQNRRFR